MNRYAATQRRRQGEYQSEYRRWVESMTAEERAEAERMGLLEPMLERYATVAASGDAAEGKFAKTAPHQEMEESQDDSTALQALRAVIAELANSNNVRLTLQCLELALNLRPNNGDSQTAIARQHGITRAAVSKRCVQISNKLGILVCRSMRPISARKSCQQAAQKYHQTKKQRLHGNHQ